MKWRRTSIAVCRLRAGERAQNLHRLADLRDQDDNRAAAVKAIQVLEELDALSIARPAGQTSPGIVIKFVTMAPPATPVDVTPVRAPLIDASDRD